MFGGGIEDTGIIFQMNPIAAYIPMDRRQALAKDKPLPDRTHGAALFADISGFTPLTEALVNELGRQRGAEELTRQLNTVYTALIERVHRYQGSVISFSGDAITCWFDQDNGMQSTACALAIQQTMSRFAEIQTPNGTTVSLAIKVAVTTGPVRRFLVGDDDVQYIDVLAGATLDDMAAAESFAEKGDVVLGPAAMAQLEKYVSVSDWRTDDAGNRYAVVDGLTVPVTISAPWPFIIPNQLPESKLMPWLLPPVYERLKQTGQRGFLAELRPAATLFLRFSGLDYDGDDAAGAKLDDYMRWVQNVLGRYEGYLLQLTVGDKGSYLYASFGAPIAHDDDAIRAVAAALELQSPPDEFQFIGKVQIGISQGRMRTGAYGGQLRRTYGVLGDEVNTSARLMGKANPGQILVSPVIQQAVSRSYQLQDLGAISLKGKAEPMMVYEVLGSRESSAQRPSTLFTTQLVGRDQDLEKMLSWLDKSAESAGQIIRIEGVTGIGKSHLAAEFTERALEQDFNVVAGSCLSTSQGTPYYPWRQIFRVYFELSDERREGEDLTAVTNRQIAQVEDIVWQVNPDWQLRLPLLGDLLGLPILENTATVAFDPRLRQEALFALASEIVQKWAEDKPLLLMIDDIHWMDEASLGMVGDLSRAITNAPVTLLFVHRPSNRMDNVFTEDFLQLPHHHITGLTELSHESVAALIKNHLEGDVTPLARSLIFAQTQGNPFFIGELCTTLQESEQLVRDENGTWTLSDALIKALREANCLVRQGDDWTVTDNSSLAAADLGIPDSVHGIVLSRIDRLPESHKITMKVASVIGRQFAFQILQAAHPSPIETQQLQAEMGGMEERDFVFQESPPPQLAYLFKHSTTQEVAYDTLLYAQRRQLHRTVAEWYENTYGQVKTDDPLDAPLAPYYALLAYHWRQAEVVEKEGYYARLAGEQAASQFANEEALTYFSRALDLTDEGDLDGRYRLLIDREAVYALLGQREAQTADLIQLQTLADHLDDPQRRAAVALRYAQYYEAISDFSSAEMAAEQTVKWAEQINNPNRKIEGLLLWGQTYWRRGKFEPARTRLNQALELSKKVGDKAGEANSLYQLGPVLYFTGDRETAREYMEKALTIRRELGDMFREASSLNNLVGVYHAFGSFNKALNSGEQALSIFQSIGARRDEALALNNLGAMNQILGQFEKARDYHEKAFQISVTLNDLQGQALAANNLGWVFHHLQDNLVAKKYYQQALSIRKAIDDKRGEGYSLSYLAIILEELAEWENAKNAYSQALKLRRNIGQEAAAIDDLTGLARVALRQNKLSEALKLAREASEWIQEHGIQGIIMPLRVYLTIADTFSAAKHSDEAKVLEEQAYQLLMQQSERLSEQETREAFLKNVPLHREVIARIK